MKRLQVFLLVSLVFVGLVSIVGSGGGSDNSIISPPGTGGGGIDPTQVTVEMGSGIPPAFTAGTIALGVPGGNLSAGGSTSLQVVFATSLGALYTQSVSVTFSSACIASNLATITGDTSTDSGVLSVT